MLRPSYVATIDGFKEYGFISGGQESGSTFGVAVCSIQVRKRYIGSLPSVPKNEVSCFSEGKRCAIPLPFDCTFDLRKTDTHHRYIALSTM